MVFLRVEGAVRDSLPWSEAFLGSVGAARGLNTGEGNEGEEVWGRDVRFGERRKRKGEKEPATDVQERGFYIVVGNDFECGCTREAAEVPDEVGEDGEDMEDEREMRAGEMVDERVEGG